MSPQSFLNTSFLLKHKGGAIFSAPWEARAFAMAVKLHDAGHFTWKQWIDAFSAEIAAAENNARAMEGHVNGYYECWVAAMERLLKKQGWITDDGLAIAITNLRENRPHPDHIAKREPITQSLAR